MAKFSLHSLPASAILFTYLLFCPSLATSQSYILNTSYSRSTFFNGWNFYSGSDPTHGFVQYLSPSDAQSAGLIDQSSGSPAYMRVDHTTTLSTSSQGRRSVRIESQKSWTHGLFIIDAAHMPASTCGVWPAFWMYGPNWPNSGEIDMIEGVNRNTANQISLHTSSNCTMQAGAMSGTANSLQCDGTQNGNVGCNVASNNGNSYGTGFSSNGGGVYATEWTSSYIKTWFFPRGNIPSDITAGSPVPNGWTTPQSSYVGGNTCNIDSHFMNQNLVFDTTFCGDWAGGVWSGDSTCSSLASSCASYVAANPSAFTETYWAINSVKVYQLRNSASSSTSTTLMTSTRTTSSTSSSKTSTSSSTTSMKPATTSTSSVKSSTTSSSKPSSTSSTKSTTSTWSSLGCYSDNVNGRSLPNKQTAAGGSQSLTVELCQSACKSAGYSIAGVEYGQECWCGNSFQNGGVRVGADGTSGCNMACKGNAKELCGGSVRLSAWKWG